MATQVVAISAKQNPEGTCAKIIQAASELFYLQGYQGTSLDMVAQKAGVNRGSLYYFFKSKKNLALAVTDHFEEQLHQHYLDPSLEGGGNGRERMARLAELYSRMPSTSSPCCGCPIGKLSLELSGIDEDLRLRFKKVWAGVIGRIERTLQKAARESLLTPGADTAALARVFFEQIQGAHLIARCTLEEENLRRDCRDAFERLPWVE